MDRSGGRGPDYFAGVLAISPLHKRWLNEESQRELSREQTDELDRAIRACCQEIQQLWTPREKLRRAGLQKPEPLAIDQPLHVEEPDDED